MGAVDFERAVLGAVLLNPDNWQLVAALRCTEFMLDSHQKIFGRMRDLAESLMNWIETESFMPSVMSGTFRPSRRASQTGQPSRSSTT